MYNFSQVSNDTLINQKINYIGLVGFKTSKSSSTPNIYTSSTLGLEIKPNKFNFSIAYRNFFNAQFIGKRDNYPNMNKSIRSMDIKNCFDIHYTLKYKNRNNFSKFGLGIYFERQQDWYDQYLIYINSHSQGLELSYYTKLKWIHIGLRQKIQLFTENHLNSFNILEKYYTQLCFEIPIKLK